MRKIKWGILGTAGIAKSCTIPGMLKSENCELSAIAGRSKNKVEDYKNTFGIKEGYYDDAESTGYEKLINNPEIEAVYVALPNNIHKEWVIKCLQGGKHVLCEKPMALSYSEAKEMFDEAKKNKVILMEAYAYLHNPYMEALKKDIASGIIGEIDYIDTAFLTQGYKEDFRLHRELGGGMVYDLGCYCTTFILSFTDAPVEYVMGNAEFTDKGVDFFTGALIKFKNGMRASFNVGMIFGSESDSRYDRTFIHGSKGAITSPVKYNEEGQLSYTVSTKEGDILRTVNSESNYALEVTQMGNAILGLEKQHITEEFSLRNARLIDLILEKIGYNEASGQTPHK